MRGLRSVWSRTTAVACAVVIAALAAASTGLLLLVRHRLVANIDAALELRAMGVALAIDAGTAPSAAPVFGDEDGFVQVVGSNDAVLSASANIAGVARLSQVEPGHAATIEHDGLHDQYRVFAVAPATTPAVTVLAGTTLEDAKSTTRALGIALALGTPALAAVVTAATWLLVGRALRPVESIRAQVADIESGHDLHRRVPEPATGDEIGRLARTMNEMLDRLERSQVRQHQFTSDAAHELRTPIASIRHQLDVAAANPASHSVGDLAASLRPETDRVSRLVDNLLWLARHDEHSASRTAALVDLDDVALDEAGRARALGVDVSTAAVSAGQVRGDADELTRAVRNLVDNAVRHARGAMAIGVRSDGRDVVVTVDDDGSGVPPERRSEIFERFTRLDGARSSYDGGSGLGLAIVAAIAHGHGGTVAVSDAPAGGARFELRLPDARRG